MRKSQLNLHMFLGLQGNEKETLSKRKTKTQHPTYNHTNPLAEENKENERKSENPLPERIYGVTE